MCSASGIVHTFFKPIIKRKNINYETELLEMRSTIINSNGIGIYDVKFRI